MNVLDLFSGIGGFSLGLERTGGFETVAFCEIDPFCRAVLRKHWPDVPIHEDIRELTADAVGPVDVVCGGFPCQDISEAGQGAGIDGERSGLWSEYARLIGEIRPRYVIVENVSALLGRGLGRVLGDLSTLGYDAEWHCIPASAVGAPHRRDRIWIVANPQCSGWRQPARNSDPEGKSICSSLGKESALGSRPSGQIMAKPDCERHQGQGRQLSRGGTILARGSLQIDRQWETEPALGRVADGVSNWSHRIKALGNAVVPQVVEQIGLAILKSEPPPDES